MLGFDWKNEIMGFQTLPVVVLSRRVLGDSCDDVVAFVLEKSEGQNCLFERPCRHIIREIVVYIQDKDLNFLIWNYTNLDTSFAKGNEQIPPPLPLSLSLSLSLTLTQRFSERFPFSRFYSDSRFHLRFLMMKKFQEEVHSDDGSYELIDFNDYAGDMEHLNTTTNDHSGFQDSSNKDDGNDEEEDDNEGEEEVSGMDFADSRKITVIPLSTDYDEDTPIKEVSKTYILQYLPAKSLARCRLVSKEWDSWISSPFFKHSQSQHFSQTSGFFRDEDKTTTHFISLDYFSYGVPYPCLSFLPKKAFLKSSCNGLLLCQSFEDDENYVCNPANKQWIELPKYSFYHGKEPKGVLAFEPSSLEFEPYYQVKCPFSIPGEEPILYFDIYDSKTKSWRICDEICTDLNESDIKTDGIFVNGVVYWETTGGKLLAFDMKNEIYGIQTLPVFGGVLSKVHGEICYVKGYYRYSDKEFVLNVHHGGGLMSLKNTITFGVPCDDVIVESGNKKVVKCEILGNSCDDVVAVILKRSQWHESLFAYHVKDRRVEGPWFLQRYFKSKLFPYVNSLVSLAA
uniref:F-box domain-containing protein n=1 Tax=Lactuca sativa TaxID=4236 RepID=A0A9R1VXV7_LACSA|nr:hypothetical protein LSAT_V11C400227380 [Lactuca sativa]